MSYNHVVYYDCSEHTDFDVYQDCPYCRIAELESMVARLELDKRILLDVVWVHVDPTGCEDDDNVNAVMGMLAALEESSDGKHGV